MDLKKIKSKKGFTLIELMVVIVIIGILVAIALPNFIAAQDRAKASSVKANMHTVQTMLETYAVDWGGVYPADMGTASTNASGIATAAGLYAEAAAKNYWKDFKNPFSSTTGPGKSFDEAATTAYTVGAVVTGLEGKTVYENGGGTNNTKYFLYGGNKGNLAIEDKGSVFFLTNN